MRRAGWIALATVACAIVFVGLLLLAPRPVLHHMHENFPSDVVMEP